jgi:Na+-translocating ferredoxin:NAD+ oxidoreductase subunit B
MTQLLAAGALAGLAVLLATVLLIASRKLAVVEDRRLVAVEAALPGINCGACGQPSCRAFAEALLAGAAVPAACSVSPPSVHRRIAEFLGIAVGEARRRVARLACAGGRDLAPLRAHYRGEATCAAAAVVAGGGTRPAPGAACTSAIANGPAPSTPSTSTSTACRWSTKRCARPVEIAYRPVPKICLLWNRSTTRCGWPAAIASPATACSWRARPPALRAASCAQDAPEQIRMHDNLPVVDAAAGIRAAQGHRALPHRRHRLDRARPARSARRGHATPVRRHDLPVRSV